MYIASKLRVSINMFRKASLEIIEFTNYAKYCVIYLTTTWATIM